MNDDAHRQAIKKRLQSAPSISSHVWSQPVAQAVRKVIDERRVAEVILAAPIMAVRFERIEAVGAEEDEAPPDLSRAWSRTAKYAHHFGDRSPIVSYMLDDLVG